MRLKELIPLLAVSLILLSLTMGGKAGSTLAFPPWIHCPGFQRISQLHLDILSLYREKFDDLRGIYCTKLSSKDDPSTKKDDDDLTVFTVDAGSNKVLYNKGFTSVSEAGEGNGALTDFLEPHDISGDVEGNIFIADTGNNRLVFMKYEDDKLIFVRKVDTFGSDALDTPLGVCASGGKVFTTDSGNDRIVVFDYHGGLSQILRPEAEGCSLVEPDAISVITRGDDWLYYNEYFIVLSDSMGGRLWKIPEEGEPSIFHYTSTGKKGRFDNLDIDYYANIYVTDSYCNLIHKLDRNMNYVTAIGEDSAGGIKLDAPKGIAIYRRFGQVLISERSDIQYFWIGTELTGLGIESLKIDEESGQCSLTFSFHLTEHSMVDLYLEDMGGDNRIDLLSGHIFPEGSFKRNVTFSCPDAGILAKCKLRLVAVAKPTYSSGDYFSVSKKTGFMEPDLTKTFPNGS